MPSDSCKVFQDECAKSGTKPNPEVEYQLRRLDAHVEGGSFLDLSRTYLGSPNLKALSMALLSLDEGKCPGAIRLDGCGLSGEVACGLLKDMRRWPLTHMDLSFNPLGTEEGELLLALVRQAPRIMRADINGTNIHKFLAGKIKRQLALNNGMIADQPKWPELAPLPAFTLAAEQERPEEERVLVPVWANLILHNLALACHSHRDTMKGALAVFADPTRASILEKAEAANTLPLELMEDGSIKNLPSLDPRGAAEALAEAPTGIPLAEFVRGMRTLGVDMGCLLTANNEGEVTSQLGPELSSAMSGLGLSVEQVFQSEANMLQGLRSTAPKIKRVAGREGKVVVKLTAEQREEIVLDRASFLMKLIGKLQGGPGVEAEEARYEEVFGLFRPHVELYQKPFVKEHVWEDLPEGETVAPQPIKVDAVLQSFLDGVYDSREEIGMGFLSLDPSGEGRISREDFVAGIAALRIVGSMGPLTAQQKRQSCRDFLHMVGITQEQVLYNVALSCIVCHDLAPPVVWFGTQRDLASFCEEPELNWEG